MISAARTPITVPARRTRCVSLFFTSFWSDHAMWDEQDALVVASRLVTWTILPRRNVTTLATQLHRYASCKSDRFDSHQWALQRRKGAPEMGARVIPKFPAAALHERSIGWGFSRHDVVEQADAEHLPG